MKNFELTTNGHLKVNFIKEGDKNIVKATDNGRLCCEIYVTKELGNYIYKKLRKAICIDEVVMDEVFLLVCKYQDDFGCYSDTHKDCYGVRPHITQEEWDAMVKDTKEKVRKGAA